MAIATISPVSGELLKSFDELTPDELEDKLARAAAAAESYRLTSVELDSGYVQAKAPKMIADDLDTPSFPLVAAAKDAVLITDAARAAGLRLGIAETVRERLQLAVESGFGRADVAPTYRVSRRTTGRDANDG